MAGKEGNMAVENKMTNMEIGRKIKMARVLKDMSQHDLGKVVGTDQSTISNIETGKRSLDVRLLEKICEVLDMACQELGIESESQEIDVDLVAKDPEIQLAVLKELLSNIIHKEENEGS